MQVDLIEGLTWTVPLDDGIIVTAAQLQHRLPCWGYVFREAGQPPLPDPAKLAASGATEVCASLALACCALGAPAAHYKFLRNPVARWKLLEEAIPAC